MKRQEHINQGCPKPQRHFKKLMFYMSSNATVESNTQLTLDGLMGAVYPESNNVVFPKIYVNNGIEYKHIFKM